VNLSQRLKQISDELDATKALIDNKDAKGKIVRACRAIKQAAEMIEASHIDPNQIPMWPDETKAEEPDF
jgi:hypothetical protein